MNFCFGIDAIAKLVIGFSLFSRDPDGQSISNFYRFVSVCIWWITLSAYTASNFVASKTNYAMFIKVNTMSF